MANKSWLTQWQIERSLQISGAHKTVDKTVPGYRGNTDGYVMTQQAYTAIQYSCKDVPIKKSKKSKDEDIGPWGKVDPIVFPMRPAAKGKNARPKSAGATPSEKKKEPPGTLSTVENQHTDVLNFGFDPKKDRLMDASASLRANYSHGHLEATLRHSDPHRAQALKVLSVGSLGRLKAVQAAYARDHRHLKRPKSAPFKRRKGEDRLAYQFRLVENSMKEIEDLPTRDQINSLSRKVRREIIRLARLQHPKKTADDIEAERVAAEAAKAAEEAAAAKAAAEAAAEAERNKKKVTYAERRVALEQKRKAEAAEELKKKSKAIAEEMEIGSTPMPRAKPVELAVDTSVARSTLGSKFGNPAITPTIVTNVDAGTANQSRIFASTEALADESAGSRSAAFSEVEAFQVFEIIHKNHTQRKDAERTERDNERDDRVLLRTKKNEADASGNFYISPPSTPGSAPDSSGLATFSASLSSGPGASITKGNDVKAMEKEDACAATLQAAMRGKQGRKKAEIARRKQEQRSERKPVVRFAEPALLATSEELVEQSISLGIAEYVAASVATQLQEESSAATLQAAMRGRKGRKKAEMVRKRKEEVEEEGSASILQAAMRGRQARRKVSAARQKKGEEDGAAKVLQSRVRGRAARQATRGRENAPPQPAKVVQAATLGQRVPRPSSPEEIAVANATVTSSLQVAVGSVVPKEEAAAATTENFKPLSPVEDPPSFDVWKRPSSPVEVVANDVIETALTNAVESLTP